MTRAEVKNSIIETINTTRGTNKENAIYLQGKAIGMLTAYRLMGIITNTESNSILDELFDENII